MHSLKYHALIGRAAYVHPSVRTPQAYVLDSPKLARMTSCIYYDVIHNESPPPLSYANESPPPFHPPKKGVDRPLYYYFTFSNVVLANTSFFIPGTLQSI